MITVSVILRSYPNAITKPVSLIINLCYEDSVCLCSWTSFMSGSNSKFKTMQCTAGTDSMDTAWDKLRAPLAHLFYLILGIFGGALQKVDLHK